MGLLSRGTLLTTGWIAVLGLSGAWTGAAAAPSLTEQLHTPPETTRRESQDVADGYLLMGQDLLHQGEYEAAITALEQAANDYHYLGDLVGMGEAYEQLVRIYSDLGLFNDAERVVRQQLAIARSNVNFSDQILALNNLGTLRMQEGDLESAFAAFSEGLIVSQDVESDSGIGLSMSNLGLISMAQGQVNDARKYFEVAAEYRSRARDYAGWANTDSNLGDAYLQLGEIRSAIGAYRLSLSLSRDLDDPYLQLRALDGLIEIYRDRDEPTMLTDYLTQRIQLTERTGDSWQQFRTLRLLGELYQDYGDYEMAYAQYEQALAIARMLDRKSDEADMSNRLLWLDAQL